MIFHWSIIHSQLDEKSNGYIGISYDFLQWKIWHYLTFSIFDVYRTLQLAFLPQRIWRTILLHISVNMFPIQMMTCKWETDRQQIACAHFNCLKSSSCSLYPPSNIIYHFFYLSNDKLCSVHRSISTSNDTVYWRNIATCKILLRIKYIALTVDGKNI